MKLSDKAAAADQPEVKLNDQTAPGVYQFNLHGDELVDCDEITEEGQFPIYGDFLPTLSPTGGRDPFAEHEEVFIECPAQLAVWLVEEEVDVGDYFRVNRVWKEDGTVMYDCEHVDPEE